MSQHVPALRPVKVLKALQRAGFYVHHIKGSHHFLKHPDRPDLRVTVPVHNDELKRKTFGLHHRPARVQPPLVSKATYAILLSYKRKSGFRTSGVDRYEHHR